MIDPKTRLQCVLKWPHDNMEKYSHIDCSQMMQAYDPIKKCFILPDQTAIFYVLTAKEAREKVVDNLRPRLYSIDPDFIKDHSSLLSLENKKELLYRLIGEEQSDWIYDMIDDFELFIDDIIECDSFNPYISPNITKSYRFDNIEINQKNQPVEHQTFYVFKEELKQSNENNIIRDVNHIYIATKNIPILYIVNDDGKQYDVIITNTSEERALACEAIRDDLSMIEIDDIIAHSSVLSNLDKNNQEKTLEHIKPIEIIAPTQHRKSMSEIQQTIHKAILSNINPSCKLIITDPKNELQNCQKEWEKTRQMLLIRNILFIISKDDYAKLTLDHYAVLFQIIERHRSTLIDPVYLEIDDNGALLVD